MADTNNENTQETTTPKTSPQRDIQRHAFQITINNPIDHGFPHEEIRNIIRFNLKTIKFFCMSDEIGKNGTYHTHIYIYCTSRVRFSTIQKLFPGAHIEPARGTVQANIDYIKKAGKWENSDKHETKVEGTYEEYGDIPTQQGEKALLETLFQMVCNGYTNADIIAYNNDFIDYIDKIDKLRTTMLIDKYKGTRRLDLKVVYIYGETGTGKTRGILDEHGDENVYRVTDYLHPFDSYNCQPVLVFEEFRSQLKMSDMLHYCDIYPIELPARYSNKYACFFTVYLTTNWALEHQYENVQKEDQESWQAFLRRIHEVRVYNPDKTVTTYHSVTEYLNRTEKFHAVSDQEQSEVPFT